MTEQQPYKTIRTEADFEVRRYPQHVVAEVTVQADFDDAGNRAFRYLFGYISGANTSQQKLAMTSPVIQSLGSNTSEDPKKAEGSQEAEGSQKIEMTSPVVQRPGSNADTHVVAFVLPDTLTEATAPLPNKPEVTLRTVPAALVAVMTYSGRWTQAAYDEHCARLLASIATAGLTTLGPPRFARYDPPYTLWFLKRNEVLVDVAE